MEEVEELNLIENSVRDASPDTKWFLAYIANIHITVYRTNFYLGAGLIPEYLKILSSLTSLDRDPMTRLEYNDNLCLFRAINYSHTQEENNLPAIYKLYRDRDGNIIVIYRSLRHHDETINLNQHGNHLSFINNMNIFGRKIPLRNMW